MKLRLVTLLCLALITVNYGQVGINTIEPDASAILDISSTNQGVLFPRMDLGDLNQAAPVTNPEKSLMVWNTDSANSSAAEGFYYWDGMRWKPFCDDSLMGVFGQTSLDNDITTNLRRFQDTNIMSFSSSSGSSGVTVNQNFTMRVIVSGIYRVKFTITYNKNTDQGADTIEFYFNANTSGVALASSFSTLSTEKTTVTFEGDVMLREDQTYGISIRRSGENPDSIPLTIFSDETSFSIERQ